MYLNSCLNLTEFIIEAGLPIVHKIAADHNSNPSAYNIGT